MAIDTRPQNLLEECEYAERERDSKLRGVDESLARRVGPDRAVKTGTSPAPENVEHEFMTYLDSMLAFDRPIVSLESPMVSKQDEVLALEVAMNRWIKATKVRQPLMQGVQDYAVAWAVFVTSERPAPELGEAEFKNSNGSTRRGIPNRPYIKRLSFRHAFRDPLATSPWDMRYAGHIEVLDKDDLIRRAKEDPEGGWNMDIIQTLPVDTDLQKVGRPQSPGNPTRNEVVIREMWVADAEIDWEKELPDEDEKERDLYHGKVFTLAMTISGDRQTQGQIIRERPFFGPRWGPYTFIGAHVVCDDPFFLSPIQPIRSAISRLNRLNDVADNAAANYKRLILVNDLVEDLAQKIKNGKHDHVFEVPGYEGRAAEAFEIAGVTNQMMLHLQTAKEKVDRGLGMGDVQRGAVTGEGSATETALASEASGARMACLERNWRDGVSQLLMTPAWYFCHDRGVAQPISIEEAMRIGMDTSKLQQRDEDGEPMLDPMGEPVIAQPYVFGGTEDYDWFDSLDLEIQAYSMRRKSESVALAQMTFIQNYTITIAPLIVQMPYIQWDLWHRLAAELTGIQEMRVMANLQVAAIMAQSEALAMFAERQAQDDGTVSGPQKSSGGGGPQATPAPAKPMQSATQATGGTANAAKPKATPLPGRSAGGSLGNKAAASVGAA
jgi:hypothetical protein